MPTLERAWGADSLPAERTGEWTLCFADSALLLGLWLSFWSGMATGWAKEGAVQEQIDATVKDAISLAKSRLPKGPSLSHCAECGEEIPQARREAVAGVRLCLTCQNTHDLEEVRSSGYNRRGSKDSQLR